MEVRAGHQAKTCWWIDNNAFPLVSSGDPHGRGLSGRPVEAGTPNVQDEKPNNQREEDERNEPYERFEDALRKRAQVPKEELNENLAWRKRERNKRAG